MMEKEDTTMSEDNEPVAVPEYTQEDATQAKATFNLDDRLKNRPMRTTSITLYTDEVIGEKQMEVNRKAEVASEKGATLEQLAELLEKMEQPEAAKIIADNAKAAVEGNDEYAALKAESAALGEQLRATSLTVKLRALPPIITKDARRITKKALDIKGEIPQDRMEEFGDYNAAVLLSKMVLSVTDNSNGSSTDKFTIENGQSLIGYLPTSEWARLDAVVVDLGYKTHIDDQVTSSPDFLQAS